MRILAITNLYPRPGHETFGTFNRLQFRAMAAEHSLSVIAPVPWTSTIKAGRRGPAIPAWSVDDDGIGVARPTYYFTPKILSHHYGRFFEASIASAFARRVREDRPDVVLGCWAHPDGWAAVRAARRAGLPVVIKVHGSDVLVAPQDPARRARIIEALTGADAVVAVSRDLADKIVELGVPPERVQVIYNGVDTSIFRPGPQEEARRKIGLPVEGRAVLFVGNLLFSKGAGRVVELSRRLKDRGVGAKVYLVGKGADEPALRRRAQALGVTDSVVFPGRRPHGELADWYRAADMVTLPSDSEGVPNVLREASACGRPFVASRVGGIPEVADRNVDRVVPAGDLDALTQAIVDLFDHPPDVLASPSRVVCPSWAESARDLTNRLALAIDAGSSSRTHPVATR